MHVQLWPVLAILGFLLFALGLAYGAFRGGGGRRRGDAAADAGAKAQAAPGARAAAVAAAVVGILLLLGSGLTLLRSGGPNYGQKGVTSPAAAQQNLDARRQVQDAERGQGAQNG